MTKTQDRQVYLDVAKGMGMLGVVASHCLVETSLGILSDWYGFFMLAVFYVYTGLPPHLAVGSHRLDDTEAQPVGSGLNEFLFMGMEVAGDDLSLIVHLDGGGKTLAAGRGAHIQHPHPGRGTGSQSHQSGGRVLYIKEPLPIGIQPLQVTRLI